MRVGFFIGCQMAHRLIIFSGNQGAEKLILLEFQGLWVFSFSFFMGGGRGFLDFLFGGGGRALETPKESISEHPYFH